MNILLQTKNLLFLAFDVDLFTLIFKYILYYIIDNMTEEDIDRTLDDDDDLIINKKKDDFDEKFGNMNNLSVSDIKKKLKSMPKKDLLKYMDKFKDLLETEKKDMSNNDVKSRLQMKLKELKLTRSSKQILNNVKKLEETLKNDDGDIIEKIADLGIKSKSQKKRVKKRIKKQSIINSDIKANIESDINSDIKANIESDVKTE